MKDYRYILEKGSKKHHCPQCSKKRLVKYLDTITGEYLPDLYGRCDRESKCSYHLNPHLNGYTKMITHKEQGEHSGNWTPSKPTYSKIPIKKSDPVCIPFEVFDRTRSGYEKNTFVQNLLTRVAFPFDVGDVEKAISQYHLGTVQNGYRSGANTFPFIDAKCNVATPSWKEVALQSSPREEVCHELFSQILLQ